MSTLKLNLMDDFAEIAASILENYGFNRPQIDDPEKVLGQFFSFQHRLIEKIPRVIYKPNSFICPSEYTDALEMLENKIICGEDLRPYQSRKILQLEYNDPLLNDWGINHLHLGTQMESNRPLIQGTKDLLFVYFKDDRAYFIGIANHETWSDQDMIRILHDNFPTVIENWRIKGFTQLSTVPSNHTIEAFRKLMINCGLEIYPGIIYAGLGGGYANDGSSAWVGLEVDKCYDFFDGLKNFYLENENELRDKIKYKLGTVPEISTLKLSHNGTDFLIVETNTNLEIDRLTNIF